MKKFVSGLIVGVIISLSVSVFASDLILKHNRFPIVVNGAKKDVSAYNVNGSTFIGLRDVALATDGTVEVKFNVVTEEIEIGTKVTTKNIENNSSGVGNVVSDSFNVYEKDGYFFADDNGIPYYSAGYVGHLINQFSEYAVSYDEGVLSFFHTSSGNPLINNVESILYKNRLFIKKDYYEETILPLADK